MGISLTSSLNCLQDDTQQYDAEPIAKKMREKTAPITPDPKDETFKTPSPATCKTLKTPSPATCKTLPAVTPPKVLASTQIFKI